jgi:hypothetical protein
MGNERTNFFFDSMSSVFKSKRFWSRFYGISLPNFTLLFFAPYRQKFLDFFRLLILICEIQHVGSNFFPFNVFFSSHELLLAFLLLLPSFAPDSLHNVEKCTIFFSSSRERVVALKAIDLST